MSPASHPDDADAVFGQLLAAQKLTAEDLSPKQALQLWLDFARIPFDVPTQPQANGLLYQWGIYNFTGQPLLHLDLVRQFALQDDDEYAQFHLDMRLTVDPELSALSRHSEWWWSDGELTLEAWGTHLAARPEWTVLADRTASAVVVFVDHT